MTYRTVCNVSSMALKRSVVSQSLETQIDLVPTAENSPNTVGFDTVADDGTAIVYKAREHRPCGTDQYDENPIP